jgi:hypothetical protein
VEISIYGSGEGLGWATGRGYSTAYVSKAVPARTSGLQHPTVDRDNIYQKLSFALGERL